MVIDPFTGQGSPPSRWTHPLPARRRAGRPEEDAPLTHASDAEAQMPGQIRLVPDLVEQLPITSLDFAPDNPRRGVGDLTELVASIRASGILQPVVVTAALEVGRYTIVMGHRRTAAASAAGLATVPAIIRRFTEEQRQEAMLVENVQRRDLTPLEEASSYARLVGLGYSQHKIAERIGRNQSHVSRRLGLLELPQIARSALDAGTITVEDAAELRKLKEIPKGMEMPLDRVLTAARSGQSVWQAVREEILAYGRAEQVRALGHELLAKGVAILPWPNDDAPRRQRALVGSGWPGEALGIDLDEHEGEPCHAATIDPGRAEIVWLCTQPSRHSVSDPRRAERQRRQRITRQRAEFASVVLTHKDNRDRLLRSALERQIADAAVPVVALACELLGLDVDGPAQGALTAAASRKGGLDRVRCALDLARAVLESWGSADDVLQQFGYQPSPDELQRAADPGAGQLEGIDPQDVEGL